MTEKGQNNKENITGEIRKLKETAYMNLSDECINQANVDFFLLANMEWHVIHDTVRTVMCSLSQYIFHHFFFCYYICGH